MQGKNLFIFSFRNTRLDVFIYPLAWLHWFVLLSTSGVTVFTRILPASLSASLSDQQASAAATVSALSTIISSPPASTFLLQSASSSVGVSAGTTLWQHSLFLSFSDTFLLLTLLCASVSCASGCTSCSYDITSSLSHCLYCDSSTYLYAGSCVSTCPSGYVPGDNNKCVAGMLGLTAWSFPSLLFFPCLLVWLHSLCLFHFLSFDSGWFFHSLAVVFLIRKLHTVSWAFIECHHSSYYCCRGWGNTWFCSTLLFVQKVLSQIEFEGGVEFKGGIR